VGILDEVCGGCDKVDFLRSPLKFHWRWRCMTRVALACGIDKNQARRNFNTKEIITISLLALAMASKM
jgi:hypothetical protein